MEKEAYAHLLRSGACGAGIVPYCYGWLTLSRGDMERVCALPEDKAAALYGFKNRPTILTDRRPPKALILEYIPDAEILSIANITPDIAEAALRSLHQIHRAYVLHGDARRHNLLVLPGGRVVWVDFDAATCASDTHATKRLTRQKLYGELTRTWTFFYRELVSVYRFIWFCRLLTWIHKFQLPDKHVKFTHWLY